MSPAIFIHLTSSHNLSFVVWRLRGSISATFYNLLFRTKVFSAFMYLHVAFATYGKKLPNWLQVGFWTWRPSFSHLVFRQCETHEWNLRKILLCFELVNISYKLVYYYKITIFFWPTKIFFRPKIFTIFHRNETRVSFYQKFTGKSIKLFCRFTGKMVSENSANISFQIAFGRNINSQIFKKYQIQIKLKLLCNTMNHSSSRDVSIKAKCHKKWFESRLKSTSEPYYLNKFNFHYYVISLYHWDEFINVNEYCDKAYSQNECICWNLMFVLSKIIPSRQPYFVLQSYPLTWIFQFLMHFF